MRIILTLAGIAALLTGSASFGIGVLAQDSPPPVRVGGAMIDLSSLVAILVLSIFGNTLIQLLATALGVA